MPANLKAFLQSFGDPAHHAAALAAHTIGATRWQAVLTGTDPATRVINATGDPWSGVPAQRLVAVGYVTKVEVTAIYNTSLAQGRAPSVALYNAALAEAPSQ